MIIIVDNGKGADEIARMIRMNNKIVKPSAFGPASAYILSDGDMKNQKLNEKIIKKVDVPVLGIGCGSMSIASAFGAEIKKVPRVECQERVMIRKPCPLTLDMKRMFSVHENYQNVIENLPENFGVIANSRQCEFEIIQEMQSPFFGVQFNPEKGLDGMTILRNFERFVEVWEKYHK